MIIVAMACASAASPRATAETKDEYVKKAHAELDELSAKKDLAKLKRASGRAGKDR